MRTENGLKTKSLFTTHFICWRILGLMPPQKYRPLYWMYSLIVNFMVTIGYPLHLLLGLFTSTTLYEVIQNLAITLTCAVCSMKTFAIWRKFKDIDRMFDIVKRQDEHTRPGQQTEYMLKKVYPPIKNLIYFFYIICTMVGLSAEVSLLVNGLRGNWLLMYHAYFPFDPFATSTNYAIAHIYQFVGLTYTILQNLVNDTFAGAHLSLLGGQVHLLGIRVSNIGYDSEKTVIANNKELLECIHDHLDLLE
ncbi:odorant receptor 59a-like [Musca vetustissima]|uniref:odorant receptor 59a-like n=1 Tax=Musca vetustissima TaxID=27455 RepID=UPI002AB6DA5B|nr:odorant receptor 59a-like [Musca vetustissima]